MQVKRRKGEDSHEGEEEERVVSIISSLLHNLARGSRRDRVCAKFVENEFEKCDHIMELYTRYDGRVRAEEVWMVWTSIFILQWQLSQISPEAFTGCNLKCPVPLGCWYQTHKSDFHLQ